MTLGELIEELNEIAKETDLDTTIYLAKDYEYNILQRVEVEENGGDINLI